MDGKELNSETIIFNYGGDKIKFSVHYGNDYENSELQIVTLLKHYSWHAGYHELKYELALRLLEEALNIAQKKLSDRIDLLKQLKYDIAMFKYALGFRDQAAKEFMKIGYDFYTGDIYLEQGQYKKALKIYKRFHKTGRYKMYWRLRNCSFLLGKFSDVLKYFEDEILEFPKLLVRQYEVRALAIAAVKTFGDLTINSIWFDFKNTFPNCAQILLSKIGSQQSIVSLAKQLISTSSFEKLKKRLIGRPKLPPSSQKFVYDEFVNILEKAKAGIWDIPEKEVVTATTILKSLASSNTAIDGKVIVEHIAKSFINPIILKSHKERLIQIIDLKLAEFKKTHGQDIISLYRDKILGDFGFYSPNEVSDAIKTILRSAESEIREACGLPLRGSSNLTESEMVRLLAQKFSPHKVIRQYSPYWLQGMRFDAFIEDFQLAVEYQGVQHFRPIERFGGEEGFVETVKRDQLKRELAAQNGVHLEYITYEQDLDEETTRIAKKYLL